MAGCACQAHIPPAAGSTGGSCLHWVCLGELPGWRMLPCSRSGPFQGQLTSTDLQMQRYQEAPRAAGTITVILRPPENVQAVYSGSRVWRQKFCYRAARYKKNTMGAMCVIETFLVTTVKKKKKTRNKWN
jgi:hypothetical protein